MLIHTAIAVIAPAIASASFNRCWFALFIVSILGKRVRRMTFFLGDDALPRDTFTRMSI